MIFPIAEAMGNLIYQETSQKNLYRIIKEKYSQLNPKYSGVAALLVLIYRHSLIHNDMPGMVKFKDKVFSWALQFDWGNKHLCITDNKKGKNITLNIMQFYKDTAEICDRLCRTDFHGSVAKRYQARKSIELLEGKQNFIEKMALKEIGELKLKESQK